MWVRVVRVVSMLLVALLFGVPTVASACAIWCGEVPGASAAVEQLPPTGPDHSSHESHSRGDEAANAHHHPSTAAPGLAAHELVPAAAVPIPMNSEAPELATPANGACGGAEDHAPAMRVAREAQRHDPGVSPLPAYVPPSRHSSPVRPCGHVATPISRGSGRAPTVLRI